MDSVATVYPHLEYSSDLSPSPNMQRMGTMSAPAMRPLLAPIVAPSVATTPSSYFIGMGGPPQPCVLPPKLSCHPGAPQVLSCTPQMLPLFDNSHTCSAVMTPREREGRRGCRTCGKPRVSALGFGYCSEYPDDYKDQPKPITFDEKYNIKVCHHECLPEEIQKKLQEKAKEEDENYVGKAKTAASGRAIVQKRQREAQRAVERSHYKDGPVTLLAPYRRWDTQQLLPGVQPKLTDEQRMDGVLVPHTNKYDVRINTPIHPVSEVFEMEMMRKARLPKEQSMAPAGQRLDSFLLPQNKQEKKKRKMVVRLEVRTPRKLPLDIPPAQKPAEKPAAKPAGKKKKKKKKGKKGKKK